MPDRGHFEEFYRAPILQSDLSERPNGCSYRSATLNQTLLFHSKILAWFPVTFVAEFLQLTPTFTSESTASEVLHSILDLPCLSATLQAQHISTNPNSTDINFSPCYAKSLAAFQDGTYKLMFGHFLRSENGKGDTIDKLASLHHLLLDFAGHERVKAASRIAPLMMR